MTNKQLKSLLLEQTGSDTIVEGYNYCILSVKTKTPAEAVAAFQDMKQEIEAGGLKVLPFVALKRAKSVLIPIPFETSINTASKIIADVLRKRNVAAKTPTWA